MAQTTQAQYVYAEQTPIDRPTPGAGTAGGTVAYFGANSVMILIEDPRDNPTVSYATTGIWDFLKGAGVVVALGDNIQWDNTQKVAFVEGTVGFTGDRFIGKAIAPQLAGDATVRVMLNPFAHAVAGVMAAEKAIDGGGTKTPEKRHQ